jgi:hypothetical protein
MGVDGEAKLINRPEKFSIQRLLEEKAPRLADPGEAVTVAEPPGDAGSIEDALPPMDELAPLPKPGDPYKAYSRPANQMLPTLHLIKGDGQIFSFPYSCRVEGPHMLSLPEAPGKGAVIVMRFSASVPVEVMLAGIRVDELHNYLGDHRIRWVRELPPGKVVTDAKIVVVRNIFVQPLSEAMHEGWPIVRSSVAAP